jgi:outer membrane protein assembly factor BamA
MRRAVAALAPLFVVAPAWGEESDLPQVQLPWTIEVAGNTRTQTQTLTNLTLRCLEETPSEEGDLPALIQQCIKNSRLFAEVTVKRLEGRSLFVTVEERWTFLAIPIVIANNSGRSSIGLFAAESNLFGTGRQLVVGGSFGETGRSGMVLLNDKAIGFSRWQGQLLAAQSTRFFELKPAKRRLDAFEEARTTAAFNVGYTFPSKLTPQLGLEYTSKRYVPQPPFTPPKSVAETRLNGQLRFARKSYKLYFDEGYSLDTTASTQLLRTDENSRIWQVTGNIQTGVNPVWNHALLLGCRGAHVASSDTRDALKLGGGPGLRGFVAQTIWTNRYAACSMDYQIPLYRAPLGTVTFAPLLDRGWARIASKSKNSITFSAAGGGIYFYLNQVAMPGMGMACAHSFYNNRLLCQFSIGSGGGE